MANDFTQDSRIKAYWAFESAAALLTDSKGTNTLVNTNGVACETVAPLVGAGSADFESTSNQRLYISDANLDSGFPLKSGETFSEISVVFRFKPETVSGISQWLVSKYSATLGGRSFGISLDTSSAFFVYQGYSSGDSYDANLKHDATLVLGHDYLVFVYYQNSISRGTIKVYDVTDSQWVGTTQTWDYVNTISIATAHFSIGNRADNPSNRASDGLIDEVVIFNTVLTAEDETAIIAGTFGAAQITLSSSLDALIKKTGIVQSVSIDALLQAARSIPLNYDAIVQAPRSGDVSLDALIQAGRSGSIDLDVVLALVQAAAVGLDIIIGGVDIACRQIITAPERGKLIDAPPRMKRIAGPGRIKTITS